MGRKIKTAVPTEVHPKDNPMPYVFQLQGIVETIGLESVLNLLAEVATTKARQEGDKGVNAVWTAELWDRATETLEKARNAVHKLHLD